MIGICVNVNDPDLFFSDSSRAVAMATDFSWLSKIWIYAFIQQSDVWKWLAIAPFRFKNIQWKYISYILCKYDENRSSNPRDYKGNKWTFWMKPQKSAYLTEYLTNYWTDLHQRFSVGRRMYGDYKTYLSFTVVQGTLLW